MKLPLTTLTILSLLIFAAGCAESPEGFELENESVTTGVITDDSGAPVADVDIHINYIFPPFSNHVTFGDSTDLALTFQIPEAGNVNLTFFRFSSDNPILRVVADSSMPAGVHSVVLDDNKLSNGLYTAVLQAPQVNAESLFMMQRENNQSLLDVDPFTVTDESGTFRIENALFGIGTQVQFDAQRQWVMPDSLEFVFIKDNSILQTARRKVASFDNNQFSFTIDN